MNPKRNSYAASQIAAIKKHLDGEAAHLQALWGSLRKTEEVLRKAAASYEESRQLLSRLEPASRK